MSASRTHTALFTLALCALSTSAMAEPTTYALDADQGRLYVLVRYERGGLLSALGHDHVIVARDWTGQVTWDADDVSRCDVRIEVPVAGLTVDPGDARSWENLDGTTSDRDKAAITENFRGPSQLAASLFPTIRYQSSRCVVSGDRVAVTGTLTVHGVSRQVTVPMRINENGRTFTASGAFDASHGDFGMRPFRALGGAIRNADDLRFVVDVRGRAGAQTAVRP